MITRRLLTCFLLSLVFFAETGAVNDQGLLPEPSAQEVAEDQRDLDKINAESRIRDLEYQKAILQAKQDMHEEGQSRVETHITLFGLLIAIGAILFAVSTREAAIAAASRGIEQERASIDRISQEIQQRRTEVNELADIIKSHNKEMEEQAALLLDKMLQNLLLVEAGGFNPMTTIIDRSAILSIRSRISNMPATERSPTQYRVLLASAIVEMKWAELGILSSEFRNTFAGNFVAKSYADFTEALALAELGNFEDARVHCGNCVGSYGFANDVIVTRNLARLSFYRSRLERRDPELKVASPDERAYLVDIVKYFGDGFEDEAIKEIILLAENRLNQIAAYDNASTDS